MNVTSVKSWIRIKLARIRWHYPHFHSGLLAITAIHSKNAVRRNSPLPYQVALRAAIARPDVTDASVRSLVSDEIKANVGIFGLK